MSHNDNSPNFANARFSLGYGVHSLGFFFETKDHGDRQSSGAEVGAMQAGRAGGELEAGSQQRLHLKPHAAARKLLPFSVANVLC
jgi:hypothetical protein